MGEWMSSKDIETGFCVPLMELVGKLSAIAEQMRDRKAEPFKINAGTARKAMGFLLHEFAAELEHKNTLDKVGLYRRRGLGFDEVIDTPTKPKAKSKRKKR